MVYVGPTRADGKQRQSELIDVNEHTISMTHSFESEPIVSGPIPLKDITNTTSSALSSNCAAPATVESAQRNDYQARKKCRKQRRGKRKHCDMSEQSSALQVLTEPLALESDDVTMDDVTEDRIETQQPAGEPVQAVPVAVPSAPPHMVDARDSHSHSHSHTPPPPHLSAPAPPPELTAPCTDADYVFPLSADGRRVLEAEADWNRRPRVVIDAEGNMRFRPLRMQCTHCCESYTKTHDLYAHIRSHQHHTKCPHCGKILTCMATFVYHVRTHTAEKPYYCPVTDCEFRNAVKYNLKVHLACIRHGGKNNLKKYANVLDLDVCEKSLRKRKDNSVHELGSRRHKKRRKLNQQHSQHQHSHSHHSGRSSTHNHCGDQEHQQPPMPPHSMHNMHAHVPPFANNYGLKQEACDATTAANEYEQYAMPHLLFSFAPMFEPNGMSLDWNSIFPLNNNTHSNHNTGHDHNNQQQQEDDIIIKNEEQEQQQQQHVQSFMLKPEQYYESLYSHPYYACAPPTSYWTQAPQQQQHALDMEQQQQQMLEPKQEPMYHDQQQHEDGEQQQQHQDNNNANSMLGLGSSELLSWSATTLTTITNTPSMPPNFNHNLNMYYNPNQNLNLNPAYYPHHHHLPPYEQHPSGITPPLAMHEKGGEHEQEEEEICRDMSEKAAAMESMHLPPFHDEHISSESFEMSK